MNMKSLNIYINTLLAQGSYFFTKSDVMAELNLRQTQFKLQAYRLAKKGIIKHVRKDFYMIIPVEHSRMGSLPAQWIIGPLMEYLQQDYYVGLLTAASMYGATEQQPMVFQVITNKATRNITLGRVRIEFHVFKQCAASSKRLHKTPTGYIKVSNKEQTVLDLIRFYTIAGYLSNVTLIIKNLAPDIDRTFFEHVLKQEKTKTVLQRLGYILELTNFPDLATMVEQRLSPLKPEYVQLQPEASTQGAEKNKRWKLILNESLDLS